MCLLINMMKCDVAVVGAGPAGLAFAYELTKKCSPLSVVVLEGGKSVSLRQKENPSDLIQGEGGAGLWSDGKFSFFPAGTRVYDLDHIDHAFESLRNLFSSIHPGTETHIPADFRQTPSTPPVDHNSPFQIKPYHSIYLSFDQRTRLIEKLSQQIQVMVDTTVTSWRWNSETSLFCLTLKADCDYFPSLLFARHLILAGGRFAPLHPSLRTFPMIWRRVEFGVRIEIPDSHPTQRTILFDSNLADRLLDPKFLFCDHARGLEWRTFCVCRQGEVIDTCFGSSSLNQKSEGQWWSCSGSSERNAGIHNIGFNVRVLDPVLGESIFSQISFFFSSSSLKPFRAVTRDQLAGPVGCLYFGLEGTQLLIEGLSKLEDQFSVFSNSQIRYSGPAIEGVGLYPSLDSRTLQHTQLPHLRVIGDASGLFRGTVPSLLSGLCVASQFSSVI